MRSDDELQFRPGRIRHQGGKRPKTFVARALAAAERPAAWRIDPAAPIAAPLAVVAPPA